MVFVSYAANIIIVSVVSTAVAAGQPSGGYHHPYG